jgi:hypothetical protein
MRVIRGAGFIRCSQPITWKHVGPERNTVWNKAEEVDSLITYITNDKISHWKFNSYETSKYT